MSHPWRRHLRLHHEGISNRSGRSPALFHIVNSGCMVNGHPEPRGGGGRENMPLFPWVELLPCKRFYQFMTYSGKDTLTRQCRRTRFHSFSSLVPCGP